MVRIRAFLRFAGFVLLAVAAAFASPAFARTSAALVAPFGEARSVMFLLNWHPLFMLFVFVVVGCAVGVVAHIVFLRLSRWVSALEHMSEHHEIAGHFLGVIGVLYAVLVAFVVVSAWQEFDHTEEVTLQEQRNVSGLFHAIGAYSHGAGTPIRRLLRDYAATMHDEWTQMQLAEKLCMDMATPDAAECQAIGGKRPASYCANELAHLIDDQIIALTPNTMHDQVIYAQSVGLVENFSENREHRRHHYDEPPLQLILWITFLLGGLVLVGVPYFVAGQEWKSELVRTCALCAMIGMMVALALAFDHPFVGWMRIKGDQWDTIVTHFDADMKADAPAKSGTTPVQGCDSGSAGDAPAS